MKIASIQDSNKSKLVSFQDDRSLIISGPNPINFMKDINGAFTDINNWFKANLLSRNSEKTGLTQFVTNSSHILISISCDNNFKSIITNITFFGHID